MKLTSGFAVLLLVLESCSPKSPFLDRVLDPSKAGAAFDVAIEAVRSRLLKLNRDEPYRLRFSEARGVQRASTGPAVVALLAGRGAPCGTGLSRGGVAAPENLKHARLEGILILDAVGRPSDLVVNGRSNLSVEDLDADGIADSLVRWTEWFDHGRPPFLVIHDLRRPGLPVMISIQFNAQVERLPIFDPEVEGPPLTEGRWSFLKDEKGYPVIAIEWTGQNGDAHSSRFQYGASELRWTGSMAGSSGFWSVNPDTWRGVSHEDLSTAAK